VLEHKHLSQSTSTLDSPASATRPAARSDTNDMMALGLFKLAAAALVVSARSGETKRAALGGGLDDGESSGRLQPPPHKRARTQPQRAPRASTPE